MVRVSRRGGFSDRNAIRAENTEIQLKILMKEQEFNLKIWLVSCIHLYLDQEYIMQKIGQKFLRFVNGEIYSLPVNTRMYEVITSL